MGGHVEQAPEPSTAGSVVLDIGGTIGAAIVHTPDRLAGEELEIRAEGGTWDGTHVGVHRRELPGGAVHAAVFPHLHAGTWEVRLRHHDDSPVLSMVVVGGRVTTAAFAHEAMPVS